MRQFATKKEAKIFQGNSSTLRIFRKRKGQRNWKTKRFAVGSFFEWINWE